MAIDDARDELAKFGISEDEAMTYLCVQEINKGTCKRHGCCKTAIQNRTTAICKPCVWMACSETSQWYDLPCFCATSQPKNPTGWHNLPMVKSQKTAKTVCVEHEANKCHLVWMAVCTLNDSSILNDLPIMDRFDNFTGHWALQL